eukprot:7404428-Pyramimonas_sp.AAC.1
MFGTVFRRVKRIFKFDDRTVRVPIVAATAMKVVMPRFGGLPLDESPQVCERILERSICPKCRTTSP